MTMRRATWAAGPHRHNKFMLPMSVRGRGVSLAPEHNRWGNVGCMYGFDNASLPNGNVVPLCSSTARQILQGAGVTGDIDLMSNFVLTDEARNHSGAPRQSTLFDQLRSKGAVPAIVSNGYSEMLRAKCFPKAGETPEDAINREYYACRNGAAVWDMSSFVKLRITGPDAASELERLCSLRIDRPLEEGKLVYCCLCNADGGVAADITVLREGEQTFYIVAGAELLKQVVSFLRTNLNPAADVSVRDVSMKVGVLHIAGPKSRDVLQAAAPTADLSNPAQPFGTARTITLGDDPCLGGDGVRVRACRISFMGDLGWELHCAMDDLPVVYRVISNAGKKHGLVDAGYACIGPLRTERMFLHWGQTMRVGVDLTADHIPSELGMPIKKTPFLGREAILSRRSTGIRRRLISIVAPEGGGKLVGTEELRRDGHRVGFVTTGSYSPLLSRGVGIGWVERTDGTGDASWDWVNNGEYSFISTTGAEIPCTVSRYAAFDPEGSRMRA